MPPGKCPICYVGEIGPYLPVNRGWPNLGPRVSILDHRGQAARRGSASLTPPGTQPGQFLSPHGLAVDSRGDLYVGEVGLCRLAVAVSRPADPEAAAPHAEADEGEGLGIHGPCL